MKLKLSSMRFLNILNYRYNLNFHSTEASKLKAQGVDILIALGHSGIIKDRELAAGCPDIDLVIGGHSHTFLFSGEQPNIEKPEDKYPVMVTQTSGKVVPVVQAYAFTKYLGFLDLEVLSN